MKSSWSMVSQDEAHEKSLAKWPRATPLSEREILKIGERFTKFCTHTVQYLVVKVVRLLALCRFHADHDISCETQLLELVSLN